MKTTKLILQLFLLSIIFVSCTKEEEPAKIPLGSYENGIIIGAEGNFNDKDGSISYVHNNLSSLAINFIYTGENNTQLGGLIQSITFSDKNAYIILNDVHTIVVVDRYTFKKKAEIKTGLKNPRYMAISNGKGYVTNWGAGSNKKDDYVAVIDLATNKMTTTKISLDNGVEQILAKNNKLYISHKGAFSSNDIISVVDIANNNATTTIKVNDNPDELFFSDKGNLVVLSEGKPVYDSSWNIVDRTTSAISFIDVNTNKVVRKVEFPAKQNASLMAYSQGKIFYYKAADKKVYSMNEEATELSKDGITVNNIYGMNIRNNKLFVLNKAFQKLSKLRVFDVVSKEEVYSSAVGLGASKIYFN